MENGLSRQEANELLASVTTEEQFRQLVQQISVSAEGSHTLLYSGGYAYQGANGEVGNVGGPSLARQIAASANGIRIVDSTEAAKFLNINEGSPTANQALIDWLKAFYGVSNIRNDSRISDLIYGTNLPSGRQPDGVWDLVSQRFVRETHGKVITITGGALRERAFLQTELPAILESTSSITHVDGIPISVLRTLGVDLAFEAIRAQSEVRAAELRIAVDDQGAPLLAEQMVVDARVFLADYPELNVDAPADTITTRPLADFVPSSRLAEHAQGVAILRETRQQMLAEANEHAMNGRAEDHARVLTALDRLGAAADVIDLAMLAHQAVALHQSGDTEAAQRLLTDWALRNASALVAGRLASLAVAPLLLAGPWGIAMAAILVLGAGMAGDQAGAQLSSWMQNGLGDWTPDFTLPLQEWFDMPTPRAVGCPLVLDLDGDGVETISWQQAGVFFDHNGDRFAERTGWVSPDDALLVRDLDGDGHIRSGAELFGHHTLLPNGSRAANGFEALQALDADGNGRVDAVDPLWSQLALWRDGDGDGAVDPGELSAPGALDIRSLSLAYLDSSTVDAAGNGHLQIGTYTSEAGSTLPLIDIWFGINPALSRALDIQRVDATVAALPDLPGMGLVPSLHQAMARDGSGQLREAVQHWIAADATTRPALLDSLLFHWAGVHDVAPEAYGPAMAEGRKLAALELFLADHYRDGAAPDAFGASQLDLAFAALHRRIATRLTLQADLAPMLTALQPEPASAGQALALNGNRAVAILLDHLDRGNPEAEARALAATITALGREPLTPFIEAALEAALSAPDHLVLPLLAVGTQNWMTQTAEPGGMVGTEAADLLVGNPHGGGILGLGGDDVLVGGPGSDSLYGGAGRNTFIFGPGHGTDWIYADYAPGGAADNTLAFLAGIRPEDLVFTQDSDGSLTIAIPASNDRIYIQSFLRHRQIFPDQHLNWITFADGTRLSISELRLQLNQGSDAADQLYGDYRPNTLRGGAGDDQIHAWEGDDLLDGGSGSDRLIGSIGSDIYMIRSGDGLDYIHDSSEGLPSRDLIQFGPGITVDNIRFSRSSYEWEFNLFIQIGDVSNAVTIDSFFLGGGPHHPMFYSVEEFHFEDGTVLTDLEIRSRLLAGNAESQILIGYPTDDTIRGLDGHDRIHGSDGNDRLEGGNGDDRLIGGPGDDWLDGGSGSNLYVFEGEVGRDVIASRPQPLQADPGQIHIHGSVLAPSAILLRRVDNDLEINESGSNVGNGILIRDYFRDNTSANPWNPVQSISWWGHATWDLATIDARVANLYRGGSRDDQLNGTADHDFLEGFAGNDTLQGGLGNDRLDGGEGIDTASWAGLSSSVTVDLSVVGPQATGTGMDTFVSIENLLGGDGHDRLHGHGGDNRIDGGAGDDTIDGGTGSDVLLGGAGNDTVSYATATAAVTVDLANTRAQRTGGSGNDQITGIEHAVGSAWDDTLTGSGIANQINGGAGADLIRGGEGADRLTGGPGADRFSYGSVQEAGLGTAGRDEITDLESADRIDLSLIDAHSSLRGNQAFAFIGSAPFTAPAQLRYSISSLQGLLEGNVDANLAADFQIALAGAPNLTAGWVVL